MSILRTVDWTIDSTIEPSDCETCGSSYEEVTVSWDGHRFNARYSVGCYGGGGKSGMGYDELVAWLDDDAPGENGLPDGFISRPDYLLIKGEAKVEWLRREGATAT